MPPKPRGRGGGRGGRDRGAYSASNRDNAEAATNAVSSMEAAPADIVPNTVQAVGGAADEGPAQAEAPTSNAREPARRRLDTLKDTPTSRSSSPSTRGSASKRGSRATPKARPRPNATRRTKEERDAREKEDLERQRERRAEYESADRTFNRGRGGDRGRGRGGDRGGRSRGGFLNPAAVAGPFSGGWTIPTKQHGISGSGGGRVKFEGEGYGGGGGGGGGGSGGRSYGIKSEGGGYISSDDEVGGHYRRKDIDTINISSDDDEPGSSAAKEKKHRARNILPIRISRIAHQDRVIGINTDASTTKPKQDEEETKGVDGDEGSASSRKGKGKGKAKDIEITDVRRPYKGVWQDQEDGADVQVKPEPVSDDEALPESGVALKQPGSPENERKPRIQHKMDQVSEHKFQTTEEREEWERYQVDKQSLVDVLGPVKAAPDASGDVEMKDTDAPKPWRDGKCFVFQLPPIMPDLLPPNIKKEDSDAGPPAVPAPPPNASDKAAVKVEEGADDAPPPPKLQLAPGRAGKLRVHKSGKTTLDWGGTSFVLQPGETPNFLQETVCTQIRDEKDRINPDDGGDAYSFGRVFGKFVVVPDWEKMLG